MSTTTAGPSAQRLLVLLFSDVVGSTDLKTSLGMPAYAAMLRRHNELFEAGITEAGGQIIKHTGDGYFAKFDTASDAVRFAVIFQERLRLEPWAGASPLSTRIGINLGQVELIDQGGRSDVVGLAADLTARVMSLGGGGQILLTRQAFDDARQFLRDNPATADGAPLKWLAHGPYLFKGNADPLEVFEVGIEGLAPLAPPADNDKARRIVRHDEEPVLGWRPSIGDRIPNKPKFKLVRKLGEGGFGEVWLAEHEKLRDPRVFKFCFNAERMRSLKREYVLFRLIKESLGDRPDIARLYDYNLDAPPYYLESEYTAGGNLLEWAERQGGLDKVPLKTRLDLCSKIADAVAAAHSVGILHKDIKPSNILIHETSPSPGTPGEGRGEGPRSASSASVTPRLSDFGIGFIADRSQLDQHKITETGFTQISEMAEGGDSRTGTRLYAAPEAAMNRPFTTQGDVFALGVLLYQLVIGDADRPLTAEWREDVTDELLAEDIAAATARDPTARLSAAELATRLREHESRTITRRKEEEERAALERLQRDAAERVARRRRFRRLAITSAVVLFAVGTLAEIGLLKYLHDIREREAATAAALAQVTKQKAEAEKHAAIAEEVTNFLTGMFDAANPDEAQGKQVTATEVVEKAAAELASRLNDRDEVKASLESALGTVLNSLGESEKAEPLIKDALGRRRRVLGDDDAKTIRITADYAMTLMFLGRSPDAAPLAKAAFDCARQVLGADHVDTIRIQNDYATILDDLGRADEAEPLLKDALERDRRLFGVDNSDTVTALNNYANVLDSAGRRQEAEPLYKEALDARRRTLGPDHPETIKSMVNYAGALSAIHRPTEAEPLYKEALERYRKVLGEDHPDTIRATNNYANAVSATRPAEAEPIYKDALARCRRVLGEDHPYTIGSMNNYASVLKGLGRPADAEPITRDALSRCRRLLGEDHPSTITLLNNYADVLSLVGRFDEAAEVGRITLRRAAAQPSMGPSHPNTIRFALNLAGYYDSAEKGGDAETIRKQYHLKPDMPPPTQSSVAYPAWAKDDDVAKYVADLVMADRTIAAEAATQPTTP